MSEEKNNDWKEEILVAGHDLVEKIKNLVAQGNVRKLIIRKPNGDCLLEIPLTAGMAVGGIFTLMAPVLAALGAMAALVKDFKVEIIRNDEDNDDDKNSEEDSP